MPEISKMTETALEILSSDTFAAIDYLNGQSDAKEATEAYSALILNLYWDKKNLPDVVAVAIAGIQYATSVARSFESADPEKAAEFLGAAKGISYNLASFTWPGWDEPGIEIGQTDRHIGLQAAKTNLRLAIELSRGDLPLSRAHWILGAQYLASGFKDKAKNSFDEAVDYARRGGEKGDDLLATGYSLLTSLVSLPDDDHLNRLWKELQTSLADLKNGQDLITQLNTAMRVFVSQG